MGFAQPTVEYLHRFATRGIVLIAAVLALSACTLAPTPQTFAPAAPVPTAATPAAPAPLGVVGPGDVLEISFFHGAAEDGGAYLIQADDILSVTVLDHAELSRERVLVLPDGHISTPGVTRIKASGKTVASLSRDLAAEYRILKIREPRVTVAVTEADSRLRSLMQPGNNGNARALIVSVDEAGYVDLPFIDPVSVGRPLREIQNEIAEEYADIFGARLEVTVNLRDRVGPRVFVLGEVGAPGAVNYAAPLSPVMALAAAGGFLNTAERNDVRLFRQSPGGGYQTMTLKMRNALRADGVSGAAVSLQPNDILFVPKTGVAIANVAIEQYIRNMLPTAVGFGLTYDIQ